LHLFSVPRPNETQLFEHIFTNQQAMAAAFIALGVSGFSLWRLKMTGFAWTTATLATAAYLSFLLQFNWLDQKPEIQALWCLPLAAMEQVALMLENRGRVRWTAPFHLIAFIALVAGLDVLALNGPTLKMLGVSPQRFAYFDEKRLEAFSVVLNGMLFLVLMLATQRAASLDLRRASKLLEVMALVHTLSALFVNATDHRGDPRVRLDVWLYLTAAIAFTVLAPFRSRWRMLAGGLLGCGLGSYLLVDLELVHRKPFILGTGLAGLLVALGTFLYVRRCAASRQTGRIGPGDRLGPAASRPAPPQALHEP
jgi:hypothetical protein